MAAFIDNLLAPFRRRRVSPTETVGAPGTAIYGGYVQENEKNSKLTGREKYRTYSNILANVSIVAAGTRYFLNLVARADWNVEASDPDNPESVKFAERLEEIMEGMETPWHRVVRRSAMYRFYGFSVQEWTAKKMDEGFIGMQDVAPRPQLTIERWDTDENGRVIGIVQRAPQTQEEIYIPRRKCIYLVDDTLNDSPEGLGLFRHIVEPVARLCRYEQLEGYGFEGDLRGIPIGRAPFSDLQKLVDNGDISAEDKIRIEKPLTDFIKNHIKNPQLGLLLDSLTYQSLDEAGTPSPVKQWDMDLLKSSSTSQQEVASAIERVTEEIARLLGVEGLLLGSSAHGSQALSNDKSHNFALIVDSTLDELEQTYNSDYIDPIWELNGWPPEFKPKFKTEVTQFRDITQITTALRDLASAGAILAIDDPAINEIRKLLGLSDQPEMSEDDLDLMLRSRGGSNPKDNKDNDDLNSED